MLSGIFKLLFSHSSLTLWVINPIRAVLFCILYSRGGADSATLHISAGSEYFKLKFGTRHLWLQLNYEILIVYPPLFAKQNGRPISKFNFEKIEISAQKVEVLKIIVFGT